MTALSLLKAFEHRRALPSPLIKCHTASANKRCLRSAAAAAAPAILCVSLRRVCRGSYEGAESIGSGIGDAISYREHSIKNTILQQGCNVYATYHIVHAVSAARCYKARGLGHVRVRIGAQRAQRIEHSVLRRELCAARQ